LFVTGAYLDAILQEGYSSLAKKTQFIFLKNKVFIIFLFPSSASPSLLPGCEKE